MKNLNLTTDELITMNYACILSISEHHKNLQYMIEIYDTDDKLDYEAIQSTLAYKIAAKHLKRKIFNALCE